MRTRSFQRYIGFENRLKNDAAVPVQRYRRGSVRWSIDRSLNASYAHFWASQLRRDDHENDHRSSRRCISKYSQSSPQVRQSSPQVRKSLVLCKEKTLRDKVGVIVIIDTRANCIAKIERQKAERKSWNGALKTRPPKTWKFRHLSLYAKGARVNHCVSHDFCQCISWKIAKGNVWEKFDTPTGCGGCINIGFQKISNSP